MVENSYATIIAKIKAEIETTRLKAAVSVNQHLLILYWKIGNIILQQQNLEGWGTKVIERLSNDLRKEFPDMKGTSARNLKYMRAFADAYPSGCTIRRNGICAIAGCTNTVGSQFDNIRSYKKQRGTIVLYRENTKKQLE